MKNIHKLSYSLFFIVAVFTSCSDGKMKHQKVERSVKEPYKITSDTVYSLEAIKHKLMANELTICDSGLIEGDGFYFTDIKKYLKIDFFDSLKQAFYWRICDGSNNCNLYVNEYSSMEEAKYYRNKMDSIYQLPVSKIDPLLFDAIHKDKRCFFALNNFLVYLPDECKNSKCLIVKKVLEDL